jgi:pimeloyl-ACP methyl ester carboxylesterase
MLTVSDHYVTAQDSLRLHVREYGARTAAGRPVICLPGLTRTVADFDRLADTLAKGSRRRVLALDYRGRGQSDYDRNPDNYSIAVELNDVIAVLTARAALPAIFIGTSRGGLIIMMLAALRPTFIAGVVLNDIGPEIETKGLMRIKGYVGKLPEPRNFQEGAEILRRLFDAQFPKLTDADWLAFAQRTWRQDGERLMPTYDVKLNRTIATVDPERPMPALWPQFDALAGVPLMVIRGANSDLLSPETLAAMRTRRPDMTVLEVSDQGHAPLLVEPDVLGGIGTFVTQCEGRL